MTAEKLAEQINSLVGLISFEYKGKGCGIDPITHSKIDIWYGDNGETVDSVEKALQIRIF